METLENLRGKAEGWIADKLGLKECPDVDERKRCPHPECSRVMLYRDIFEHFFATHIFPEYPYQVDRKQEETTGNNIHGDDFSVSDYVEDYEIGWDQEEDEGLELQEATGGKDKSVEKARIRKRWKPYIQELRKKGRVHIGPREKPLGKKGPRGSDAAQKMASAIRRLDVDFDVSVDHRSQGAIISIKR